MHMHAALK